MRKYIYYFFVFISLLSCNKDYNEKLTISESNSLDTKVKVINDTTFDVKLSLEFADSVNSIGVDNQYFGRYKKNNIIDLQTTLAITLPQQVTLFNSPGFSFIKGYVFLKYKPRNTIWGFNTSKQLPKMDIDIYELTERIGDRKNYYIEDIPILGQKIAGDYFKPDYYDSTIYVFNFKDSVKFSIGKVFELEEAYINKFINYYYSSRESNLFFSNEFKGIAIVNNITKDEEVMLNLDLKSSYIGLAYNSRNEFYETKIPLSGTNFRYTDFNFSDEIVNNINNKNSNEDFFTLTPRTRIKVDLSSVLELKKLKGVIIHDAEIQLKLYNYNKNSIKYFAPPSSLKMYYYDEDIKSDIKRATVLDQQLRPGVFLGVLNTKNNISSDDITYTFNISAHIQKILTGENSLDFDVDNPYVYIEIEEAKNYPGVVFIENVKKNSQTRFQIVYSYNH